MSSRTLEASASTLAWMAGLSGALGVPLKEAVAELRRVDTSSLHSQTLFTSRRPVSRAPPGRSSRYSRRRSQPCGFRWPRRRQNPLGPRYSPVRAGRVPWQADARPCGSQCHRRRLHPLGLPRRPPPTRPPSARRRPPPARLPPTRRPSLRCPVSSRTLHALAGRSFGGWREGDCWPVDSFAGRRRVAPHRHQQPKCSRL
jgi:hypothetical protein